MIQSNTLKFNGQNNIGQQLSQIDEWDIVEVDDITQNSKLSKINDDFEFIDISNDVSINSLTEPAISMAKPVSFITSTNKTVNNQTVNITTFPIIDTEVAYNEVNNDWHIITKKEVNIANNSEVKLQTIALVILFFPFATIAIINLLVIFQKTYKFMLNMNIYMNILMFLLSIAVCIFISLNFVDIMKNKISSTYVKITETCSPKNILKKVFSFV